MRRKDREIKDFARMTEILKSCGCCRLGLVDAGSAYIVPMNFGCEIQGDTVFLYFHSAKEGRKMNLLCSQPSVTFEADCGHELLTADIACGFSYQYRCVMGKGTVEILAQADDKIYGLQKIMEHYSGAKDHTFDFRMLDRIYVLRLTVTEWSCKEH